MPYLEAYHYDYTDQDLSDDYITEHDYNGEGFWIVIDVCIAKCVNFVWIYLNYSVCSQ